jgi:hypothetical protein
MLWSVFWADSPHTVWFMGENGEKVGSHDRRFFDTPEEARRTARRFGWWGYELTRCGSKPSPGR